MTDPILEVAETIQTASINQNPSAAHDVNPSTSASEKIPVVAPASDAGSLDTDIVDEDRQIRPVRRRQTLPALPDLRFEQSYLASLKDADTWGRVAWITVRDQMLLPLFQGTLWTLALAGWRHWNRNASLSGQTLGSRLRRWWYGVNNWELPPKWTSSPKLTQQVEDFYQNQFSNAGSD
ncbi:hypothetical protein N7468_008148 [Penicillium chermesinum]|uniref:DUF1770-domain-containing protein n=1 Tax=Penicillium chermesinum TaxID=63820 RepID=A0A9W9NP80_9EURO|nr:uncharacterized protein N7468_008148 [Penicillium chermesinum]KAJ5223606.1 hypothetical protein N7468_008148 [Penicillium chermesinum]KAJ6155566.1 hypothetical protein N7470_006132 [Penicillium chermesinum]